MGILKNIRHNAAVTVCVAAMSIGLAAAAQASTAGPAATGRPASLALPGGLQVVSVPGSRAAADSPSFPAGWVYNGLVQLANWNNYSYVISVQPSNSSGRVANRLYMWANSDATTQYFYVWAHTEADSNVLVFQSEYNGDCINVPGVSTHSTQLIVYPCQGGSGNISGIAENEVFDRYGLLDAQSFTLSYDSSLALAIGSNFPGNGAWVISYGTNYSNPNEQWRL